MVGRIGRLSFRFAWDMPELEIVHINELVGGAETAAYLAKYDSVHGIWSHEIEATATDALTVDGQQKIAFSEVEALDQVPWAASGVELVIDCTGK